MLGVRPFPDRPEILALSMYGPVEALCWTIIPSMLDKQYMFAIVGPFLASCSIEAIIYITSLVPYIQDSQTGQCSLNVAIQTFLEMPSSSSLYAGRACRKRLN